MSAQTPPMVARIAPTPSGYLHRGNAVNFLLTDRIVRDRGGRLLLRIDDIDVHRTRPQYVDDVFAVLEWLGICPDAGPSDSRQFHEQYSLRARTEHYRQQLATAARHWRTYRCTCSRRALSQSGAASGAPTRGGCPGRCWNDPPSSPRDPAALRIHVPEGTTVAVSGRIVDLAAAMGDFVLWRRDGIPSYQLASAIEDRDAGVNAIVRGMDLLDSSAAQLFLAGALGATSLLGARFWHHELVMGDSGQKLSKSRGDRMVRSPGELAAVRAAVDVAHERLTRRLGSGDPLSVTSG